MGDQWSTRNREDEAAGFFDAAGTANMGTGGMTTGGQQVGAGAGEGQGTVGEATEKARDVVTDVQHKAGELGSQATAKADAGMQKAAGGLDSLASTLREKSETMGGGQAQSLAATAAEKIEAGAEKLRSTDTDQMVSELESLVRRRPVESLLVAAGIGYLLSRAR
jgi:ElaB/YqjD/DUF883 family membrane-anchored ribosome-binding protein